MAYCAVYTTLGKGVNNTVGLHVEYATYGSLFIFSLIYEYSNLEYEHVPV